MRIIQYPITLKHGYCLFNCPNADDGESYGDPSYPGISMKVIKNSGEQDIIDLFGFMTDMGNPDFEEHWRETLCGQETLWKIVRVIITDRHIYLQFASEHFLLEEAHLISEIDTCGMNNHERSGVLDNLPEGTDYMSIDTTSMRATLQFEVPHPYDSGADIIEVELRENYGIAVTETDGNKKRKFEIYPPIEKEDIGNFYTIVTECM